MMKNSNVEWIGQIPDDWDTKRLKLVLKERNESNNPEKTNFILSLTNDRGVIPYDEKGDVGNKSKDDITGYKLAYPNDIVLNSMNVVIGSVGISKYFGAVSPVYYILFPRYENDDIRYYNYIFQTCEFQNKLKGYGNGIMEIRMRIQMSKLNSVDIPVPNSLEQRKIADLLDKKCGQIDRLIEIQQQEIEKLKEYKTSVITQAVTKGLDPNVPMKESGIEWIGKIPQDWKTLKIKFTSWLKGRIGWDGLKSTEFIDEGPYLITGTDFSDGKINWNTCVHITEERFLEDELLHIKENDLLITKDGTIGKLAIVKNCPEKVSLNSGVMIIRSLHTWEYIDKYLYYVLSSEQFYLWYELGQSGNSTIKHLYQGQFYNFEYTYPNIEEQKRIINYLDNKCSAIESMIVNKNKKIEKLQEFKKSMIYEYVTGKRRVI